MANTFRAWLLLIAVGSFTFVSSAPAAISTTKTKSNVDKCKPLVIAHRGASGYVPEHTLGAYALAITMGADYVEPDLVMTRDGHLVARHDNELGLTTDVAMRPEFADRFKTKTIDGHEMSGWFTEDFTLAEIKTLRAVERIPETRPGNARMNGIFQIPTFQEIINLVKSLQISQMRPIGIYPEIKHSTYFKRLNLPMENLVVETFRKNGYTGASAPVYIQSFEVNNLKYLKTITDLKLLQLYESNPSDQPYDQVVARTGLTYADMAMPYGLKKVAKYATAVGPDKSYIIPRNQDNTLGEPTSFVQDAHAAGLKVHPYTFRAENTFLPSEFRSKNPSKAAIGDLYGELRAFFATGIDGLFTDQPDKPIAIRENCIYS
ncbi:glycerophosphodiester phosphodiesterase GDPD6 [Papilio machaon]|uniref:glycerophosphodiester phosphodiesterase GDPD6 n=1 Tax=Papilio machaon TaxID=76193 RepID=UPI001E66487E|nr:glycerophosphodiester phosphodiesterase GDPD6 [Papilio machaon]XP_014360534.2 glycerophosphodiester phosphodiesterase GDPD6 [Papilio machaon]